VLLDSSIAPLISVIVLGMCVGFLPFNFHPARIFMGDGGALPARLLMAASTMVVGGRIGEEVRFRWADLLLLRPDAHPDRDPRVPIVVRCSPSCAGPEAVGGRERRQGAHPPSPDAPRARERRSVLILWGWTLLLSVMVLYPAYAERRGEFFVPIGIVALALALYTVLHPGARTSRAERRAGRAPSDGSPPGAAPVAASWVDGGRAPAADAVPAPSSGPAAAEPRPVRTAPAPTEVAPAPAVAAGDPEAQARGRVTPEQALASLDAQWPTPEAPRTPPDPR
jgi:UDP-GlcNAc:undecaprenyl-phosphate GlcNAc-1-phosphate transferase